MHQRNFPSIHVSVEYAVIVFNGLGEYACRGNLTKKFDLDDERHENTSKKQNKKTREATCPLSGCSFPSVSISKGFWKVIGRIMISTHLTRFSRVQLNCLTGLSPTKLGIKKNYNIYISFISGVSLLLRQL